MDTQKSQSAVEPVKIYLDEDVHGFIARALRLRGWEVLTTPEADRLGATDDDQLRFASESGFAILTYNVGDFARLHYQVLARGTHHAGILIGRQLAGRHNLGPLFNLLAQVRAEDLRDQLVYLSNWSQ